MEYFFGSLITLITIVCFNLLLRKKPNRTVKVGVLFSQSRLNELVKPLGVLEHFIKAMQSRGKNTQSKKHNAEQHVRVIISETEAYWIANNKFYTADVRDSLIIQETTREVDTMAMDDVQLKKIIEIVDMLGKSNDSRGSGNKNF
jgi:hypothetical protein